MPVRADFLVERRGFELMAIAAWRPRFERFRHGISNMTRADLKAAEGIGLVYGGGGNGLMGRLARSTLAAGGYVTGIIPSFLIRKEHALTTAQEMVVVEDMHERKQTMFDRADAFVALPGGIGTLEELVEMMTWAHSIATPSPSSSPTSAAFGVRCCSSSRI
jgi:predicted Rossmann-fold nucleotide-binding protein